MAFGTWFKNIAKKIGTDIKKALPILQTIGQIATGVIAPALGSAGRIIGGSRGRQIGNWGTTISNAGERFNDYISRTNPQIALDTKYNPSMFNTPMLK